MLVAREDLDRPFGMFRGFLGDGVDKLFFERSRLFGRADFGFFGRGVWIDMPQPSTPPSHVGRRPAPAPVRAR